MRLGIFFLFFFSLLIFSKLCAQTGSLYVVQMKSGLQIKCEILSIEGDSFVNISQFGLKSRLSMSEISSIKFSEIHPQYNIDQSRIGFTGRVKKYRAPLRDTGWAPELNIGFTIGSGLYGATSNFVTRAKLLYMKGNQQYGFFAGFDPYARYESALVPAGFEIRNIMKPQSNSSSFLFLNSGYAINVTSVRLGEDGGFNLGLGYGRMRRNPSGTSFFYSIGFKHQTFKATWYNWSLDRDVLSFVAANRFEFNVGWRY